MNIKITKLELTNFKCFRHKEFSFNNDVTVIRGRNGVGKTTVADAILWCLFGKNLADQATFDLKTHDADGNTIPHLDHSVEMVLTTNAITGPNEITLKRTLTETWVKKRGATEETLKGHTTEYMVNGEVKTATDYKKYISEIVSEDVFRAITNPQYFPSLKWQQQREFLAKIAGYIDQNKIVNTVELSEFASLLVASNEDIIDYRKHLSYQIKQVKDKLDKIPIRLEEQNKALPECLDWDKIQGEAAAAKVECDRLSDEIIKIKSGNGGDVFREQIRKEIKDTQNTIDNVEEKERKAYNLRRFEHDNKVSELSRQFNSLVTSQRDLEQAIPSFETFKKRCQETLDQCNRDAQQIREEWANNLSRKLSFTDSEYLCPTCGQYLPEEQVAEKRKKAEENLNTDKARIKSELTQKAEMVKATRSEAEKMIADYDQKKAEAEKNLTDTKEQINKIFSDKAKAGKEPVLSLEQALAESKEYQELLHTRDELQKKLDSVGIDEEAITKLTELEAKKVEYNTTLTDLNAKLATRLQYDKIKSLIQGIEKEQKDLITQLSELERKEDVARKYQDRQNAILEEKVNLHFKLVKWRMFRTVNNGGDQFDEPYCECYSPDGSAYHDGVNQAMRLNMGLDIIN